MGALGRAFRRFFRALGFKWAGEVDEAADALATNPHAVRATYVEIVGSCRVSCTASSPPRSPNTLQA